MEKSFIATSESKLTKDLNAYYEMAQSQREFINKFFSEHGIEANKYLVSGSGGVCCTFDDWNKSEITLSIDPTDSDIQKFGSTLSKPSQQTGLCKFRKTSKIGKIFAQRCVDEKIIINLWGPRIGDYFRSINMMGASWERLKKDDSYYIKIDSNYLKEGDIPEGFIEIKLSEYHRIREEIAQ
jgi:hypothetical protein